MKPKNIALIGGAAMIVGSLLPWLTLSDRFDSFTFAGTDEGFAGVLTLIIGVVIVLAALVARETPGQNGSIAVAILGIIGAGAVFGDILSFGLQLGEFGLLGVQLSFDLGIIMTFIGAVVATTGGYRHNPGELEVSMTPRTSFESWSDEWRNALTQPIVATYETIAGSMNATTSAAYRWIFISALVTVVIQLIAESVFGVGLFGALGTTICIVLIAPFVAVLGFAIAIIVTHGAAKLLGGVGTRDQYSYAVAAYAAPLAIIAAVLGSIPAAIIFSLNYGFTVYGSVLGVIAVKSVYKISWGRAIVAVIIGPALVLVLVAIIVIVILAILGPTIGNVFSNIVSNV